MRGEATISPVYKMGAKADDRDPFEVYGRMEAMRRKAWLACGVVAVRPAELPAGLREQLNAWAEAEYGKR